MQLEAKRPHETLWKWAKEYGDIMRVNLFGEEVIIANGHESITEVLVTKSTEYAGRTFNYRCDAMFKDDIIFGDFNPKWNFMKKICMNGLKQVGDQETELENNLQGFLDDTVKSFIKHEGKAVNVRDEINAFVNGVNYTLIYGNELSADEHKLISQLNYALSETLNPTGESASLDAMPFLRGPWYSKHRELMKVVREVREFYTRALRSTIEQHGNETRCALDSMIKEMKNPSVDKDSEITFQNVNVAGMDLAAAGMLSTSSALYYLISLMATKPDLQEEAYKHIMKAIGHRPPTLQDRFSVPYIQSMIFELLRLISNGPVSVPHKTLQDTTLGGYEIPAGTQVWTNLWFTHHDERLWEDPWEFKPKRFLDQDGNFIKADHPLLKQFYAFGAGRRVCIGENLAKHRMFLFIVTILQKFRFVVPEGEKIATDPREFELGFTLRPFDYKVKIELRV